MAISIVHNTASRLRLRLPRLAGDADFAAHLIQQVQALAMVTEARINLPARSLIVHYQPGWPVVDLCTRIDRAAARAATLSLAGAPRPALTVHLPSATLSGVGWVLLATGAYAAMQAAIRLIAGTIHPFQIVFLSNLLGVGLLLPTLTPDTLQTDRLSIHGLRALLDTAASLLLFSGLSLVPLAQVNALGFTTPLFAILGASLFLGESMRPQSWLSLGAGILGTLVIVRPGLAGIGLGSLLVLGGSVAFAGVLLLLKVLSRTDSSRTSITYNALLLTPLTLVPALAVWTAPTLGELAILALIAGLAIAGQACMANALEKADATAVLPADFAQLLWASGLGYLLFREVPDLWTWLGALLIFAGVLYAAYGEGEPEAIPGV
jgi:drug/metabolite transporter (DMT)-like permease